MSALKPSILIAQDLNDIALLLEQHSLVTDCKPLFDAVGRLYGSPDANSYSYECCGLKFAVDGTIAGCMPRGVSYFDIVFSIAIEGRIITDNHHGNPIQSLNFDIELHGMDEVSVDLYSAWHLDKHVGQAGDGPATYIHPEYHLTFGGNKMEEKGDIYGKCLIVPMPRIVHPPMDAVLGIDFIIQNYIPYQKRIDVINDPKYLQAIKNSHLRLWKPFFCSISSAWYPQNGMAFSDDFHHSVLLPFVSQGRSR